MRVVWFCHFSLQFLKDKIELDLSNYQDHAATWIYYLAEALGKHTDITLHIISLSSYINEDLVITDKNLAYHILSDVPPRSKSKVLNKILTVVRTYKRYLLKKQTRSIIKKINPDLITIHGTEHAFGKWIKDGRRIPVVIWMQGVMNFAYRNQHNKASKTLKKQELEIFRNHKYYVSKKGNMETFIRQYNNKAIFFNIFYPVAPRCFKIGLDRPSQVYDFIFAGTLIKRKGIEDFLSALSNIKANKIPFTAVIVGGTSDEQYYSYVQNMSKELNLDENLTFTGTLPKHDQVLEYISKSGILVLPTYADTAPVVVAESQACKTGVIAYDVDGVPGMIEHDKTGMLVELFNVKMLAETMIALLGDKKKLDTIVETARSHAEQMYHPDLVANKTKELYNYLFNKKI